MFPGIPLALLPNPDSIELFILSVSRDDEIKSGRTLARNFGALLDYTFRRCFVRIFYTVILKT